MLTRNDVAQQVRTFMVSNVLLGQSATFSDEDSFLEQGILDSTGVLELVSFLEQTYGVTVADEDLVPDNLDSIRKIALYIEMKTSQLACT